MISQPCSTSRVGGVCCVRHSDGGGCGSSRCRCSSVCVCVRVFKFHEGIHATLSYSAECVCVYRRGRGVGGSENLASQTGYIRSKRTLSLAGGSFAVTLEHAVARLAGGEQGRSARVSAHYDGPTVADGEGGRDRDACELIDAEVELVSDDCQGAKRHSGEKVIVQDDTAADGQEGAERDAGE